MGSLLKMNYINFSVAYQETLANKNKTTNDWTEVREAHVEQLPRIWNKNAQFWMQLAQKL